MEKLGVELVRVAALVPLNSPHHLWSLIYICAQAEEEACGARYTGALYFTSRQLDIQHGGIAHCCGAKEPCHHGQCGRVSRQLRAPTLGEPCGN